MCLPAHFGALEPIHVLGGCHIKVIFIYVQTSKRHNNNNIDANKTKRTTANAILVVYFPILPLLQQLHSSESALRSKSALRVKVKGQCVFDIPIYTYTYICMCVFLYVSVFIFVYSSSRDA